MPHFPPNREGRVKLSLQYAAANRLPEALITPPFTLSRLLNWARQMPSPIKGALYMSGASFCFATLNLLIRLAAEELETMQIAFFRALFALLVMLPWALRQGAASLRTAHLKTHIGRSLVSVVSMYLWFTAVVVLPLADAVALNFTAPLFVTIGAALILGELVGLRRWSATAIGFIGTLVIIRPGFVDVSVYSALPILAAACIAINTLIVKRLSQHDSPGTIVLYMNLLLTPLCLIPALFVWVWPSPKIWMVVITLGLLAAFAHILFTRAFIHADASAIQPFDYTRLPFVAFFGYVFFAEVPSPWLWLGGAMIIGAAIYTTHRETVLRQKPDGGAGGVKQ